MTKPSRVRLVVLFSLIFLSGMAGLIYQVVWHKYLAILLGAQARATAIVLAIFLGGISLGYLTFGHWCRWKKWNLYTVYAAVELGLGFWAFAFPTLFKFALPLTASLYRSLGVTNLAIDVLMSVLLIGPPTFLMGGTLPLLTQALAEDVKKASRTHAMIYGVNTVGACLGCLLAGYYLIPMFNLPCTSIVGGTLNTLVAMMTYFVFAKWEEPQVVVGQPPKSVWLDFSFTNEQKAILAIGFLSGFYLITLETVLIRLMGLSTGASNYNFTLIVAIFIFGLGIGSLFVRRMSDYTSARLFWNQIVVSAALLILYLTGDYWSYSVHLIRVTLRDIPQSFYVYQLGLGIFFLALLVVPIGFSGLTLPLCFHLLKDKKETLGNRVGQLYGLNTVGCVLGALLGGYALFAFFDLDQLFKICIFLSLVTVAAASYLYVPALKPGVGKISAASALVALVLGGIFTAPRYTKERWIQPFRHAQPIDGVSFQGVDAFGRFLSRSTEFLYWKDGNNTSVGIGVSRFDNKEHSRTIFVNGKSDGNTRGDYFTTIALAHIPALLAKKIERTCVIGLGTGTTIGTMALYPESKTVDVAEISDVSIKNAHYFDNYNFNVSNNPKVRFHEMDAFRYLAGAEEKFDIIISEPSNPWVAGIENLYSSEFYQIARDKMTEDGLFVQWIHTYSFDDQLFRMVLNTMQNQFKFVSVYQLKGGDIALLAMQKPLTQESLRRTSQRMYSSPAVTSNLMEGGIKRFEALLGLELIPSALTPSIARGADEHRLESPRLSNLAAKAFFVGSSARVQALRRSYKDYFPSLESSLMWIYKGGNTLPDWEEISALQYAFCESIYSKNNILCEETIAVANLVKPGYQPTRPVEAMPNGREIASLGHYTSRQKAKFTAQDLSDVYQMFDVYKKYASPIARLPLSGFMERVDYCLESIPKSDELFGECLLQKILVMETTQRPSKELTSAIHLYLEWFPSLDRNNENYAKLEDAKEILEKMIGKR